MKTKAGRIATLALLFSLTACGGGGDPSQPDPSDPLPSDPPASAPVVPSPVPAPTPVTPSPTPAPAPTPSPSPSPSPTPAPSPAPTPAPAPTQAPAPTPVTPAPAPSSSTSCVKGTGTDYVVGQGQPYTTLDLVPWESLKAGDTVRITYSATPYKGKFMLGGNGTATAPIVVCGIKGPNGERPIISGDGATTRAALQSTYGSTADVAAVRAARAIIEVNRRAVDAWDGAPSYITLSGLDIRSGHPNYSFTGADGVKRAYDPFGACIWVDRGSNITITDNVVSDCQMAVFSKSIDDGMTSVTQNLLIKGNVFSGHGIVGDEHMHTTYTQGINVVIEGNTYAPMRVGSPGNQIKDRSAGLVVRFNNVTGGAHAVDMVEAEDFPTIARAQASYRSTHVYGNLFTHDGVYSAFHYGGDHFGAPAGANWGETLFRQGTLYFWNNTVIFTGRATRDGISIGFGLCEGEVLPAPERRGW